VEDKHYYVYILTNYMNSVLYTGVTNDLKRRVWEHREKIAEGFTKRYHVYKLVYYESTENVESAIMREKQIKAGSRKKKMELIDSMNPKWQNLYDEISNNLHLSLRGIPI
jgi:putative endonuclease